MLTKVLQRSKGEQKLLITVFITVCAVVLPQLFHLFGRLTGYNEAPGAAFLPMHFPIFFAGLLAGPIFGLIAGIISPLVSFAISGMPSLAALPFMAVELGVYGLVCGLLQRVKMPVIFKVLSAQVLGRLVKALAIFFAAAVFSTKLSAYSVLTAALSGIVGLALQLVLIPLAMFFINKKRKKGGAFRL